jgi:hypothetical protein
MDSHQWTFSGSGYTTLFAFYYVLIVLALLTHSFRFSHSAIRVIRFFGTWDYQTESVIQTM